MERVVRANRPLSKPAINKLSEYLKEYGQRFLEDIDNWIVALKDDDGPEQEKANTGLGMYHYVESKEDKTSLRQLLADRGWEIEEDESD